MRIFIASSHYESGIDNNAGEFSIDMNPTGRKLRKKDLLYYCKDAQGIIAGSEVYDKEVLAGCNHLKVISRLGVGVDNIDLEVCERRGIKVCSTPDAPTQAVAEFTVGQILTLIRGTHYYKGNRSWNRLIGRELSDMTVGILGVGRIGTAVSHLLHPFGCKMVLCDRQYATPVPPLPSKPLSVMHEDTDVWNTPMESWKDCFNNESQFYHTTYAEKVFEMCDLVTIHIPMDKYNKNFVNSRLLDLMPLGSFLINTSRGGIVDEEHLYKMLKNKRLQGAAIDVFEDEPYRGPLQKLSNVLWTPHMAWATQKAKIQMEREAWSNCVAALQDS